MSTSTEIDLVIKGFYCIRLVFSGASMNINFDIYDFTVHTSLDMLFIFLPKWFMPIETMFNPWHSYVNKTDVGRRETLGHRRSINPNMINHVPQQSPLIFEVIYVVCTWSNNNFVFVSSPMSRFKKLSKSDVSNHSFVDMVRSPFQYRPSIQQIYLDYQNVLYHQHRFITPLNCQTRK